jgi:hypothetical protein
MIITAFSLPLKIVSAPLPSIALSDSAVASCKLLYDEPEEAEDLAICIQSAKDDYQSCIEDCTGD